MNGWLAYGINLPFCHAQIIVFSRTRRELCNFDKERVGTLWTSTSTAASET